MNSTKNSLLAFGFYMILLPGIGLMAVPDLLLNIFQIGYEGSLWSYRQIGLLAFIIGVYYVLMANHGTKPLYKWTVILRYFAGLFMTMLWLTGQVEISILLFVAVDSLGATWTLATLNKN